jgi:hypothetical protein
MVCETRIRRKVVPKNYSLIFDTDALFEHCHHAFSLQQAAPRNVNSLKNWTAGTGDIGRQETAYLNKREDLVTLVSCEDGAMERVEWILEDILAWFHDRVRMVSTSKASHLASALNLLITSTSVSGASQNVRSE